ncbi:hypothetical protein Nepgr_006519 [Nepenthes gracilis]|uniref:Uncharacterized protein n=1 Tax=Nepenthes gracilis TaxID=150966 RepID=A0AAD3XHF4_NEPGR|nr:hypothetical protein Nepgr_006519 [Nepenthes gracilis]
MAVQTHGDQFDAYFRRADLDQDGRISGAEAVSFFQGSGLPKQVLAQIWMHADQNQTGFLSRQEFYNALKLVTVAQSKRELTPDIVKAALYGPASSKISAPQINFLSSPLPLATSTAASPAIHMGAATLIASQNVSSSGQSAPNTNMNRQYFPFQGNHMMRPPQVMPASPALHSPQSVAGLPKSSISADWLGGRTGDAPSGPTSQAPTRAIGLSLSSVSPKTQDLPLTSSQSAAKDSKASSVSGNGFVSDSVFVGDAFSSIQSQSKRDPSPTTFSASPPPPSPAIIPVSSGSHSSSLQSSFDSLQSSFTKQPVGNQTQTLQNLTQSVSPVTSSIVSPGISAGVGNSSANQSQLPWPKMTAPGIQKYTKVFMEVDTDRDGKITGVQARNLFLSWRLPRDVLKQVWDLADQDNDSMLSLREFCIALYLMERYREGSPLPEALPNSIQFDEALMRMTRLPNSSHGFGQMQGIPVSQPMTPVASLRPQWQPMAHAVGLRPPMQGPALMTDGSMQFNQQNSMASVLNNIQANQFGDVEQNSLQSNPPESTDDEKKGEKMEKVILDSKEKLEFYRTKMQELVLYKSRCDNRLNEIIERAHADKREADLLGKKYEEKYKQVAEIASKLTIEEANFREYQERKMELRQAIVNMEQGGSADGILQSDLEELLKALSERCKKHSLEFKTAALIELPKGWQPGIQEGAAIWDEDWDKFDDEGLVFDKEFTGDAQNARAPEPKSMFFPTEPYSLDDGFSHDSLSNADGKSEKQSSKSEHLLGSESEYTPSEDDSARSPPGSPARRTAGENPSHEFSDIFTRDSEADPEFNRSFNDHAWGTFDTTDDTDSIWGFNPSSKDSAQEQHVNRLFESSSFGSSLVVTGSPRGESTYNKKSLFFADSVPGTPFSKSACSGSRFSPPRENFVRFDSINSSKGEAFGRFDSISSSRGEAHARFDSMSSSRGFDHSRGLSFDDSDPFGSSGPFKVSAESETPRKGLSISHFQPLLYGTHCLFRIDQNIKRSRTVRIDQTIGQSIKRRTVRIDPAGAS